MSLPRPGVIKQHKPNPTYGGFHLFYLPSLSSELLSVVQRKYYYHI